MKIKTLKDKQLSLTNSGELELFFIGVGSAFTKKLYQTNLLIIKGEDHILIDCGTKSPQGLHELGVPVTNIKNFLITHSHADHVGGLEEVTLMSRYVTRVKPVMIIDDEYRDMLWNMSLKGGIAFNEGASPDELAFDDFWDIIKPRRVSKRPRPTYQAKAGGIDIKIMRTKHIPDSSPDWKSSAWSCGIIIDNRVLFTSDTRFDEDLVCSFDKIFSFEAIFHDCQFFTGGVHAGIDELNQLPPDIKEKTYLVHYGDNWEDFRGKVSQYGFAGLAEQHVFYTFD